MSSNCEIPQRTALATYKVTVAAGTSVVSSIGAAIGSTPFLADEVAGGFPSREYRCAFESCNVLNGRNVVMNALFGLPGKYRHADWDGYGAEPLSESAWKCACTFAWAMPVTMEAADVGVDADGDVTFEWFHSKDEQCLLTFSSDGKVYCNVKSGESRTVAVRLAHETDKIIKIVCEVANV